jgi:hypothetical protein
MPRRDLIRHPRTPLARWVRRILGVTGTAVVLAVGVATATMILSDDDEQVVPPAPAAIPLKQDKAKQKKSGKHESRLTARQRNQRRRAADQVRRAGYSPVKLADYFPQHVLRVLIGKPVGSTPPGLRAFFFVRDRYIGQDATTPSMKLRPGRQLTREITLVYTLYEPGDRECCPQGGDTRVHFRWTGDALEPREQIPPAFQRMPPTI